MAFGEHSPITPRPSRSSFFTSRFFDPLDSLPDLLNPEWHFLFNYLDRLQGALSTPSSRHFRDHYPARYFHLFSSQGAYVKQIFDAIHSDSILINGLTYLLDESTLNQQSNLARCLYDVLRSTSGSFPRLSTNIDPNSDHFFLSRDTINPPFRRLTEFHSFRRFSSLNSLEYHSLPNWCVNFFLSISLREQNDLIAALSKFEQAWVSFEESYILSLNNIWTSIREPFRSIISSLASLRTKPTAAQTLTLSSGCTLTSLLDFAATIRDQPFSSLRHIATHLNKLNLCVSSLPNVSDTLPCCDSEMSASLLLLSATIVLSERRGTFDDSQGPSDLFSSYGGFGVASRSVASNFLLRFKTIRDTLSLFNGDTRNLREQHESGAILDLLQYDISSCGLVANHWKGWSELTQETNYLLAEGTRGWLDSVYHLIESAAKKDSSLETAMIDRDVEVVFFTARLIVYDAVKSTNSCNYLEAKLPKLAEQVRQDYHTPGKEKMMRKLLKDGLKAILKAVKGKDLTSGETDVIVALGPSSTSAYRVDPKHFNYFLKIWTQLLQEQSVEKTKEGPIREAPGRLEAVKYQKRQKRPETTTDLSVFPAGTSIHRPEGFGVAI